VIARVILASIANRGLVLLAAAVLALVGVWSVLRTPLDALPDLSDTQVIIRTSWPGQTPRIVEDQVTYPLTTTMLSVPGVKAVRGFSAFGDSFVYVLFDDDTDLYWARSRVLEYLSQVRDRLPAGVTPSLGPDATGLGWIYEYAIVDRTGRHDLGELRSLQDWFLRYELKTVPDVAEVASVGGMVQAWQVVPDPAALVARGITIDELVEAIRAANGATGGSVIEQGEAEVMVRSEGYLREASDFEHVPIRSGADGVPVLVRDVARVQRGPTLRRGIAELDGEGEVAGGIVILRSGKNALAAIDAVKAKLAALKPGLPPGVEIGPVHDSHRSRRPSLSASFTFAGSKEASLAAARLQAAPVLVDLTDAGVVGIVGPREGALALARSLLAQAAVHVGPADLTVGVFCDAGRADEWAWASWLPHTRQTGSSTGERWMSAHRETSVAMLRALKDTVQQLPTPALLVVLDSEVLTEGRDAPAVKASRPPQPPPVAIISSDPTICTRKMKRAKSQYSERRDRPWKSAYRRSGRSIKSMEPPKR